MEIINTTFRIGIIIGIFAFIWSLVQLAVLMLSGGQRLQLWQHYTLKLVQYFFLVQVTFMFCFDSNTALSLSQNSLVVTFIILLIYFVSKFQNSQQRRMMVSVLRNQQAPNQAKAVFDKRAEIGLVVLSLAFFLGYIYDPSFAENRISLWIKESIINIEDTPIFGFIFKVVGFFFLFSIFNKIFQSIAMLFGMKTLKDKTNNGNDLPPKDNHFDDYEDVSEEEK